MSNSTLKIVSTFTRANELQPDQQTPPTTPTLTDSTATQAIQLQLVLPAAGATFTLPIPAYWTKVTQVQIVNIDTSGYVSLQLNATDGAPAFPLAPSGGAFAMGTSSTVISGGVVPTPTTWTLRTMDSDGTTAGADTCAVLFYCAGY